ncbi:VCBS domain-containing protein, partial [Methylorubrum sp. POS3]|uniref:VCBS domain-containing protein n=1 Tax=Methylorubrum sp. POS3 TaxID=2998492 RepID=UPI00372A5041
WSYAIADKALDFIGQNDTVRVVTTVQVNDGNGGVAQQAVTIALKGVNDAPVIVAGGQVTGSVTEKAGAYGDASLHLTGGSFDFADID